MGRVLACDFETTVYENQETTEVWAAGMAELFQETEPLIFNSFDSFFFHAGRNAGSPALLLSQSEI